MIELAAVAVRESDLVPAPQGDNRFTVRSTKNGVEGRLQIRPDGEIGWQSIEKATGEWEVGWRLGSRIVWTSPSSYPTRAFALPLIEGV